MRSSPGSYRSEDALLHIIREASQRLNAPLAVGELCSHLIEVLQESLGHRHVVVFTLDASARELQVFAESDPLQAAGFVEVEAQAEAASGEPLRARIGILDTVLESGQSARLAGVPKEASYYGARFGIQAQLCVPMHRQGKPVGMLLLESSAREPYGAEDQLLLETLAPSIAQAIESARLFHSVLSSHANQTAGRLTTKFAHDMGNLLTVVNGFASILEAEGPHEPGAVEAIEAIRLSARGASELCRRMLTMGDRTVQPKQRLELGSFLRAEQELLERLLGERIRFNLKGCEAPAWILADRNQLQQVLWNLASNARDAMPGGGCVTLDLTRIRQPHQTAAPALDGEWLEPGEYWRVEFVDDGPGMSSAVLAQVFESFTSARPAGAGLGLSIIREIASHHGAEMRISSEAESGTSIRFYFPLELTPATGEPRSGSEPEPGSTAPEKTRTPKAMSILLIEDEDAVRRFLMELLVRSGYLVHAAGNGREALELAEGLAEAPGLLLTDFILPDMTGPEVRQGLERLWPDTPALMMSGYSASLLPIEEAESTGVAFLPKPFTVTELRAKIEEAQALCLRGGA